MARRLLVLELILAEERLEEARRRRLMREEFLLRHIPDGEFLNTFRLTPEVFETLCQDLLPHLNPSLNSRGIDPVEKIMISLKFFGRGDYQGGVGRDHWVPMSQPTVSKCLHEVIGALNSPEIINKYVKFPITPAQRVNLKIGFNNKFGLPGLLGAIDCTHVALHRPILFEERFFNRKHFHSLNVQVICDDKYEILNVDASYGGATHDAFIWNNSPIRQYFENLCNAGETAILLGDSGYPLREYLLTPVPGAVEGTPEGRFNATQKRARCTIERTFGILKGRRRCLLAARELYYDPETVGRMVIACSVLHNLCVAAHLEPLELDEAELALENELQRAAAAPPARPAAPSGRRRGSAPRSGSQRNSYSKIFCIKLGTSYIYPYC